MICIKRAIETRRCIIKTIPGDEKLEAGFWYADDQVLISAPPNQVWPWIVQMGNGRAGWYSYDLLDNLGRKSSKTIVPELQNLKDGESFGLYQVDGFKKPEYLTFRFSKNSNMSWSLEPLPHQQTQLVTRVRVSGVSHWLLNLTLGPGHKIMQAKQFREIKKRAEGRV